jgi:hypothetical protein
LIPITPTYLLIKNQITSDSLLFYLIPNLVFLQNFKVLILIGRIGVLLVDERLEEETVVGECPHCDETEPHQFHQIYHCVL